MVVKKLKIKKRKEEKKMEKTKKLQLEDFTEATKNIETNQILFVQMHYNEKIGKWQVTGNVGGVY
ncbi:hypothetical protein H5O62_002693 [Enterococcus faecalis]|nr:hypothetical protein [Enterococcus faecalis]